MAILDAGHIPAGMELFAANDKSQWETIKKWIDESDVFVLILGGRYGSIESETQKSYIELEYDFAIQKGKPFFAIVISQKALDCKYKEKSKEFIESADQEKLKEFRGRVMTKTVNEFDTLDGIKLAIHKSLKFFEEDEKIMGWVRPDTNKDTLKKEYDAQTEILRQTQEEVERLKSKIDKIKKRKDEDDIVVVLPPY